MAVTKTIEERLSDESQKLANRLEELKSEVKGQIDDALAKAEVKKLADVITEGEEQKQRISQLETAIQRISTGAFEGKDSKEHQEEKAKFEQFLRKGGQGTIEILEKKELRTDSDPQGGYLVRPQFSAFIAKRVFETSPMRQLARIENIGTNELIIDLDDGEADCEWVGQGQSFSKTDTPEFGQIRIPVHKLAYKPKITVEALEDSTRNLEAWLQEKAGDKFARIENSAFVSGNGVGKPRGFLSYGATSTPGAYEREKLERIKSGAAGAFTADGVIKLQNSLKEAYQARATFVTKRANHADILTLKGTDNYRFIGFQPADRQGVVTLTLLGKPVVYADDMPAVGNSALALAYGDFAEGYTIVDRSGIIIIRDPLTVDGYVVYKINKRTGGGVTNFEAIKLQNLDV